MQDNKILFRSRIISIFIASILTLALNASLQAQTPTAPRTPTETVREFYKQLRERHFREGFALSVYKYAIEGLTPEEFEDLKPDFEHLAANVPENIEISGEQISGNTATVFVKSADDDAAQSQAEAMTLVRDGNAWIIVGDPQNEKAVKADGKEYFFKLRISTHQQEAQEMLLRIAKAQFVYGSQHAGQYADLGALVQAGLLPEDVKGADSTGYNYRITLGKENKTYTANAEPARYGRTGRLSYFMDPSGIKSADTGGKPYTPKK